LDPASKPARGGGSATGKFKFSKPTTTTTRVRMALEEDHAPAKTTRHLEL